jgi:hypothetical protein
VGRSYKENAQEKIEIVRDSNQSLERVFENKVRHQSQRQIISFSFLLSETEYKCV